MELGAFLYLCVVLKKVDQTGVNMTAQVPPCKHHRPQNHFKECRAKDDPRGQVLKPEAKAIPQLVSVRARFRGAQRFH